MESNFRCSIDGVVIEMGGMVDHRGNKLTAIRSNEEMPNIDTMFIVEGNENFCFAVDLPNMNYYHIDRIQMEKLGYKGLGKFIVGEIGLMHYEVNGQGTYFGKVIRPIKTPFTYPKSGLLEVLKDGVVIDGRLIDEDTLENVKPYFFDVSEYFVVVADFDRYAVINRTSIIERFARQYPIAEDINVFSLNDRLEIECKLGDQHYGRTYGAYELDLKDELFKPIVKALAFNIITDELTNIDFWEVITKDAPLIFTSRGVDSFSRIKVLFPDHIPHINALLSYADGPSLDEPVHGIESEDGKLEIAFPSKDVIFKRIK